MGNSLNSALLTQLDQIPAGLTESSSKDLFRFLPGPTLIHLQGSNSSPLFVSVLLHGNEFTGLAAVQLLLKKYQNKTLPRSISIFFGNIHAARLGLRRSDGQPDYNRIWPGTDFPESPETAMTRQVVDAMARRKVFASIDIHNNTGINPHYACINVLNERYLQLAALFSRLVVYFIRPKGVLSAAFAKICPSVTLECGKPGQEYGIDHAFNYLDSCLHLEDIPKHAVSQRDINLFHTVAQVIIKERVSFDFQHNHVDLALNQNLDHMNFTEIPAGTVFGKVKAVADLPVLAISETGEEVTDSYFTVSGNDLIVKKSVMPSMLTLDTQIIRQDCLCYLMERISQ